MKGFDDIMEGDGTVRRENVLYLVGALEQAIRTGGISWTAQDAEDLPRRLANVSSALRRQASI